MSPLFFIYSFFYIYIVLFENIERFKHFGRGQTDMWEVYIKLHVSKAKKKNKKKQGVW